MKILVTKHSKIKLKFYIQIFFTPNNPLQMLVVKKERKKKKKKKKKKKDRKKEFTHSIKY